MKKIVLLGASGSVGSSTLQVLKLHHDEASLVAFSVYNNDGVIATILKSFPNVALICVKNNKVAKHYESIYPHIKFVYGDEGLVTLATSSYDLLVNALVGFIGLIPTYHAINSKHDIALANKETLVSGGKLIMQLAKENHVRIYPIDSEHSAIFQCLEQDNPINKLYITASGGPFYNKDLKDVYNATKEDALKHPTWKMGNKITIDSATLMNKAFEIIEAYYLFQVEPSQIKVLFHPQSIIHSLVEFKDGSIKAQLSNPDMCLPIAYAIYYPNRINDADTLMDFNSLLTLTLKQADESQHKALKLAYQVLNTNPLYGSVLNGANEAAVSLFLDDKIKFGQIVDLVSQVMDKYVVVENYDLQSIIKAHKWAYTQVKELL